MNYPLHVSGSGSVSPQVGGSSGGQRVPAVRRFAPVMLFLTRIEQHMEAHLQTALVRAHKEGRALDQICNVIYHAALAMGYHITIGVQEIYSSRMPSFPQETVATALLMIDFTELKA